jgi:CBS domain-containing protein
MRIRDLMTRRLETIPPDASLRAAADKMKALNIGALPVWQGEAIAGIITDRDIAVRAVAAGKHPDATRVSEAMTPEVIYCGEDDEAADAVKRMAAGQVRRLVVRDAEGRAVGIVSVDDLAASRVPLGLGPNLARMLSGAPGRRGWWRLALAPLALWGIGDAIWLAAAPRRWGRFWGERLEAIPRRRAGAAAVATLRGSLSALLLLWAFRRPR